MMQHHQTTVFFNGFGKDTLFNVQHPFNNEPEWVQASKLSIEFSQPHPSFSLPVTMKQIGDRTYMVFEDLPAEMGVRKARIWVKPARSWYLGQLASPDKFLDGHSTIETADGQIFKQIDGRRIAIPEYADENDSGVSIVYIDGYYLLHLWGVRQTVKMDSAISLAYEKPASVLKEARKLLPPGKSLPKKANDALREMLNTFPYSSKMKVRALCDVDFQSIVDESERSPRLPATGWQQRDVRETYYVPPEHMICVEGDIQCEQIRIAETFVQRILNPDFSEVCFRGELSNFSVSKWRQSKRGWFEQKYFGEQYCTCKVGPEPTAAMQQLIMQEPA